MGTSADIGKVIYDGSNAFADFIKSAEFSGLLQQQYAHLWNDSAGTTLPVASIIQYGALAAPAGWLLCDGTEYPASQYGRLSAAIGTTYGGTAGSTFKVPDLRGRVPVGVGNGSGLTSRALNNPSGAESVSVANHSHAMAHTHTYSASSTTGGASGTSSYFQTGGTTARALRADTNVYDHSHGVEVSGTTSEASTTSTGDGGAHNVNVMQPYVVVNFIIKSE
jgi:hypothetical protein